MAQITIIGGGNLGKAIAEGLINSNHCKASDITITKRNLESLDYLKKKGVKTTNDNNAAIKNAKIILLNRPKFSGRERRLT